MNSVIDLDEAGALIESRVPPWRAAGLEVGPVTWRDQGVGWPPPIKPDRSQVSEPDSVGVAIRKGAKEGSVVLYNGGWADLLYWSGEGDDVIDEVAGWGDPLTIERFGQVLDRLAGLFQ